MNVLKVPTKCLRITIPFRFFMFVKEVDMKTQCSLNYLRISTRHPVRIQQVYINNKLLPEDRILLIACCLACCIPCGSARRFI